MEWLNHSSQNKNQKKTKKKNKVAAISDGEMVIKIALFEEFSSKVLEGDMSSEAQIPLT